MADSGGRTIGSLGWFALAGAAAILIAAIGLHRTAAPGNDAAVSNAEAPADPAAAIASLENKMRAHPDDGEGWRSLGWSYFQMQRYADAAGAYAKATRLLPNRAAIWSAFGEAQTLASNAVDPIAHDAFGKALAIDPKDSRARYFLAVEKDVRGDHQGAIDDWIALLRDGPKDAPWAQSVHDLIVQVAAQHKIDVKGRVPDVAPAAVADAAGAAIPGPTADQMNDAASLTPGQQNEMARGMVDRLAQRLAGQPDDFDGWVRLMRARMVLRDGKGAGDALADARRAFAADDAKLARLTDAARALNVPGA
ncbi:tetratricopeptide repeat protein [Sphingomonas sp.]|uniref:tetratricopeptide repeat protein n=1 Tax=Sphingomonas sp. TaxID=28214 RepID=UPI0025FBE3DE|nr:tetratricopeptide repeat protein [Sphingomonas sp.]